MKKILVVIGTRPEAIKLAPVISELRRNSDQFKTIVCLTAQHRQIADEVLQFFEICPDYDLDLMRFNQNLGDLTGRLLIELDRVIGLENPEWVLVQGDTATALAASLAACYRGVKVGHVEAGLRTGDRRQPFPEEINRRVIDLLADLYFAPTERNCHSLLQEGIASDRVVVTGNTVIDALLATASRLGHGSDRPEKQFKGRRIILVTAHRRENFRMPLRNICHALRTIARLFERDIQIVYPVHPNPHVCGRVHQMLGGIPNISLLPPMDYKSFVSLLYSCYFILTDSGGIQEEAPSFNKPVLILRNVTERTEITESGAARLVGTQTENIIREVSTLLTDETLYSRMASVPNPYGDGLASNRIVRAILANESHQSHESKPTQISAPA